MINKGLKDNLWKPEVGLGFVSIFLALMFVFYFISYFMIFTRPLTVGSAILAENVSRESFIGISVFGIPNISMSVATYILAKRRALKIVSVLLIIHGIIVLVGMIIALDMTQRFVVEYKSLNLDIIPKIFIACAAIPIGLGIHLYTLKPQPRSRFFEQ